MIKTNSSRNILANRDALFGAAFALLSAIGYSGKAILVKLAYLDIPDAVTLQALRMGFSVPFFIGMVLWDRRQHSEALGMRNWLLVLALGMIYYFASILDFLGLQYISAGLERLIVYLYPTMTVILSAVVYRRAIGRKTITAMLLCYAGIVLVFLHNTEIQQESIWLGAALVFASTLSLAVYFLGVGHAVARIGATRFTAYSLLVTSAASLLHFATTRPLSTLNLPPLVYQLAFSMAIFSTVLPGYLLFYAIRRIGSANTSMISSIGPISTIYLAYVFLNEGISLLQILGSALVLGGVLIISLGSGPEIRRG
ncbi:MAG: DMT family transporter [Sterolibacterium sp.]